MLWEPGTATGLGPLRMTVKFALHDMMYQGKLAI